MLTFFTTGKPFRGHDGIIQRNALKSWKRLHPEAEIILFGDDEGSAEAAAELGIRHAARVRRNESNTILLDDMFEQAHTMARHDILCYSNCDIILTQDLCRAVERVKAAHAKFLMIGRRWDVDITQPMDFHEPEAGERLRRLAQKTGVRRAPDAVDYFVFSRGLYPEVPAFAIGRLWWDHWLVWKALNSKAAVIDGSAAVLAVHQNHGYGHHPLGWKGVWRGQEAQRNLELAGGRRHLRTIADATHVLLEKDERKNLGRCWAPWWRYLRPKWIPIWFAILNATRPIRKRVGLRAEALSRLIEKV